MKWILFWFMQRLYVKGRGKKKIEVIERHGKRDLFIGGYSQSCNKYRKDWTTLLAREGVLGNSQIKEVLILGLGGGDIVKILQSHNQNVSIEVVEIDSQVIEVAKEFFGIVTGKKLKIVQIDAKEHLAQTVKQFDCVIVDIYDGDSVPSFVASKPFISNLSRVIARDGIGLINYASHDFDHTSFARFEKLLGQFFNTVRRRSIWGHNYYVVSEVGSESF